MKKIKKTIIETILTFICIAMLCIVSFAAKGVIYFSDPEASVGDTVNVTIKIETDSPALGRADVTLKYPESGLEFIEGHNCDGGAGIIRIHGNVSGGDISQLDYSISFKALKAGQHVITVDYTEVYDINDNPVELTHTGSSTVTVTGGESTTSDSSLTNLEISPGVLQPKFDPDVKEYAVNVGMNVENLTINAQASDVKSIIRVEGNEHLSDGDNTVTIDITASDGISKSQYILNVKKTADGEENVLSSASEITESQLADGIQLSSNRKTITVLNLPDDLNIPVSFQKGTISIDKVHHVQGLVSSTEGNDQPDYVIVYGMNEQGEMNFYRYDMKEKTIQRYFADPVNNDTVSVEEFNDVQIRLNETTRKADLRFILICVLAVLAFALLITVILLSVRLSSVSVENKRSEKLRERADKDILKHGYSEKSEEPEAEKTVVIAKKNTKNESELIPDETVIIKNKEDKKEKENDLDGFEEFKL